MTAGPTIVVIMLVARIKKYTQGPFKKRYFKHRNNFISEIHKHTTSLSNYE